jgi:hypothetical protein
MLTANLEGAEIIRAWKGRCKREYLEDCTWAVSRALQRLTIHRLTLWCLSRYLSYYMFWHRAILI